MNGSPRRRRGKWARGRHGGRARVLVRGGVKVGGRVLVCMRVLGRHHPCCRVPWIERRSETCRLGVSGASGTARCARRQRSATVWIWRHGVTMGRKLGMWAEATRRGGARARGATNAGSGERRGTRRGLRGRRLRRGQRRRQRRVRGKTSQCQRILGRPSRPRCCGAWRGGAGERWRPRCLARGGRRGRAAAMASTKRATLASTLATRTRAARATRGR